MTRQQTAARKERRALLMYFLTLTGGLIIAFAALYVLIVWIVPLLETWAQFALLIALTLLVWGARLFVTIPARIRADTERIERQRKEQNRYGRKL